MGRVLKDLDDPGFCELFLLPDDPCIHDIARNSSFDENHKSFQACDSFPFKSCARHFEANNGPSFQARVGIQ